MDILKLKAQLFLCFFAGISLFGVSSCMKMVHENGSRKALAQVGNKTLYASDLTSNIPAGFSEEDSIAFVESYIDKWIKQQLLVNEAEKHLSNSEKDVHDELEKYKEELIIFKYQSQRVPEILNKSVPYQAIEDYYNSNLSKFELESNIVRVSYLVLPLNKKITPYIKKLAVSNDPDDIGEFEEYANQNATKYDNFSDNWVPFNSLIPNEGINIPDEEAFLKKNQTVEYTTDKQRHFIVIRDYKLAGETAPIDQVEPQIRHLLINKKKLDFLREIKDSLYSDALKYNKFRVFN